MKPVLALVVATLGLAPLPAPAAEDADPYLWLEEVQGERALEWVEGKNRESFAALRDTPLFEELYQEAYGIMTSKARLPEGRIVGDSFHEFWQDETHVRGVWRRTSVALLASGKPQWETILDVDALALEEGENWVYKGINCAGSDSDRCLVQLSHGGKDESVYREFSLTKKTFVDDGFIVPEAKSTAEWLDEDRLLLATDWGADSLTNSGYAREVRLWRRGTPLATASSLWRIGKADTLLAPAVYSSDKKTYAFLVRLEADWNNQEIRQVEDGKAGTPLALPQRVQPQGVLRGQLILVLGQDWDSGGRSYHMGDVIAYELETGAVSRVFAPGPSQAVDRVDIGADSIYLQMLDDVAGRLVRLYRDDGAWQVADIGVPANGVAKIAASSSSRDDLFVTWESINQPKTLYYVDEDNELATVAAMPALYDAADVVVEQRFATSADGTRVPYFVAARKSVLEQGKAPTILYGYGGFLVSTLPVYYDNPSRPQHGALAGRLWLSRGGVLALANLRGGGEYGPAWHQAALRENRQRAYDDYFAIAEDLIDSGVTAADRLGALGRSNGGLLLGVALTQRPDLFAALDIGVPLLDMKRYNQLLAGSSWMGEYGNPDVAADWEFISEYSPYQNLAKGADYPRVFFYTSTLDDRVHPGHARKMAFAMENLGYDTWYYENTEGGHGGTANQDQLAMRTALEYAYFMRMLMPATWDRQDQGG